jgi:hypothetical protein
LDIPFSDYPIPSTEYQSLYLHEASRLAPSPQVSEGTVAHKADSYHAKPSEFVLKFDKATTLVGHSKAELWMSCKEKDDMDVYVSIRKLSKSGEVLEHVNVPWEALPEGVNTQHDVPMAQTVKVSCFPLLRVHGRANHRVWLSTLAQPAFSARLIGHRIRNGAPN